MMDFMKLLEMIKEDRNENKEVVIIIGKEEYEGFIGVIKEDNGELEGVMYKDEGEWYYGMYCDDIIGIERIKDGYIINDDDENECVIKFK